MPGHADVATPEQTSTDALPKTVLADRAGHAAAVANRPRVPALCRTFRDLIAGLPVGGGVEIADAWLKGYQRRCDEEAAEILAQATEEAC